MKGKNKIISFIFAIAIILTILMPNILKANTTADGINDSYVSAITIKETITGLAPFDKDDNPGNDSNATNNIVRSFDNINYTLEYITELKTNNPISEANLCVEFILPCTKDIATFDLSTMSWIINPEIVELNGKQILTGRRFLQNSSQNNAIPGAGTLSIGIKVQAAPNATKITPEFKLYMEGNNNSEIKSIISNQIIVSAAQKYDILIKEASEMDWLSNFNMNTGNSNASQDFISNNQNIHGRLEEYGITFMLKNDTIEKGLKGLELPKGTITFDLELSSQKGTATGQNMSKEKNYTPLIWDYSENERKGFTGHWGRQFNKHEGFAYGAAPFNKLGCHSLSSIHDSCYNGGNWTIVQDTNNPSLYHVTIENYEIDTTNFNFPTADNTWYEYTSPQSTYKANQACISSGVIQTILQFPTLVDDVGYLYHSVTTSNIKVNNIPYEDVSNYSKAYQLNPPGTMQIAVNFTSTKATGHSNNLLSTWFTDGNSYEFKGNTVRIWQKLWTVNDKYIESQFSFIKFDANAFRPDLNTTSGQKGGAGIGQSSKTTGYYVGRLNNYQSQQDLADTLATDENLHFFTNLNDLENAGYTCIGIFLIADTHFVARSTPFSQFYIDLKIQDTAQIGQTYAVTSEGFCNYTDENPMTQIGNTSEYSINRDILLNSDMHLTYSSIEKHKEIGETVSSNRNYTKTEYDEEGNIIAGTHSPGWNAGTSLLIVGEKASVNINIVDTNKDGSIKTAYDMDNYERTVNYEIQPYVDIAGNSSNIENEGNYTNITILNYLPKDLYYNEGSSFYNNINIEPEIINNNGQTILKWEIPNIEIGKIVPKLTYNCTIGKAGTNQDVQNNQIITNKITISSTEDKRATNSSFGNLSTVSFNIIKLNAIAISKTTNTPYVNIGQDFSFKLKYANNSENALPNSRIYDILPYKGDARGSDFSGFYKINNIIIDFSNAPKTFTNFTNNNYMVGYTDTYGINVEDFLAISSVRSWIEIPNKSIDLNNKIITYTGLPENVTGLIFNMSLEGLEYIEITLNISPTGQQKEGDIYINGFYQYSAGQSEQVHSNHVLVQVYGHLDITKIWQDDNNRYNTRPSNLDIKIYQDIHDYKTVTLNSNNAVTNASYKWTQRVDNVPMYDTQGNPYVYTIEEDINDINSNFYFDAIYDQSNLTVTNIGIWVKNNNYPEYMIIVNKDIINKNNQTATIDDFNKIKLNNNQEFQIVLKQLNRIIINNGTTLSESYNGYSGNEYHGIVTDNNQLIFRNIPAGKYEISENIIQYFEFIGIEKIESSENALFTQENGKYYLALSGISKNNEHIEVKVTNKINDFRPYDKSPTKDNLFNVS